jgi:hypothetical protein
MLKKLIVLAVTQQQIDLVNTLIVVGLLAVIFAIIYEVVKRVKG